MVSVFREVKRVLRDDGTLWLNLGDSYAAAAADRKKEHIIGKSCTLCGKGSALAAGKQPNKITEGLKPKDLVGIPWRVALALQADGWYLRQDIIWSKPNPMPESVRDRCTKSHEYIFLLSKSQKYYYDYEAIKEPAAHLQPNSPGSISSPYGQGFSRRAKGNRKEFRGGGKYTHDKGYGNSDSVKNTSSGNEPAESLMRNKRSVWSVATRPFTGSHFATFPPDLIEPCILAGSPIGGIVFDPFFGAGTTGMVSQKNARSYIGIEINPDYAKMAEERIKYGTADEKELKYKRRQMLMDFAN